MKTKLPAADSIDMTMCVACGRESRSGAKFCPTCGVPLLSAERSTTGSIQTSRPTPHAHEETVKFDLVEAFIFPFRESKWVSKLLVLPLLSLIPVFSNALFQGWQFDIIRRVGTKAPKLLPNWDDVGSFFGKGMILWMLRALYLLPLVILTAIFRFRYFEIALVLITWVIDTFVWRTSDATFLELLSDIGVATLTSLILPFLYLALLYPMYQVAVIRYAVTGQMGSFFKVFANLKLTGKHFTTILALFFYDFLTRTSITFLSGLLASTVIGVVLVPTVLMPISYWIVGYLTGTAARRIYRSILLEDQRTVMTKHGQGPTS